MITDIIPSKAAFYRVDNNEFVDFDFKFPGELDLPAICIFTAIGFFPGNTTYFKNLKVASPATKYTPGLENFSVEKPYWDWHYSPREISFKQAVEEFAHLFEGISKEQTQNRQVILPLSGGLDSRSQAAVLENINQVSAYSYQFENGINENKYGAAIAESKGFKYTAMTIPNGYLWDTLEDLAQLNYCLSDFTHQRQMAVASQYDNMGDLFFLGHWGDVLFDDMGVPDKLSEDDLVDVVIKKILKKGGKEIAERLWQAWDLPGDFMATLNERIWEMLSGINIGNANAKIRAFKSTYWAPRWTSTNLCVFQNAHRVALPYYHNEMCKFICEIPEEHLAARKIQIEYIKVKAPELATLPWQSFDPCNLYNYADYYKAKYLPIRAARNLRRKVNQKILKRTQITTRNWEIQFCGNDNEKKLGNYLFDNKHFNQWIPQELVKNFYSKFKTEDDVFYSHPVSMFLTLSVFSKLQHNA